MIIYTVDNFINQHKHINYCEAVILKNGSITYATPSHLERLIALTGYNRSYISSVIPVSASPIEWIVSSFDFIPVWYDMFFLYHRISRLQKISLVKLVDAGVLSSSITGRYTCERQWVDMLASGSIPSTKKVEVARIQDGVVQYSSPSKSGNFFE